MKQIIALFTILALGYATSEVWSQGKSEMGRRQQPGASRLGPAGRESAKLRGSAPQVGEVATDFQLKSADGERAETLAELRAKKPVVLLFGSYT